MQQSTTDWLAAYDAAPTAPTPPKPVSAPKPPPKAKVISATVRATQHQPTADWIAELDAAPNSTPKPVVALSDDEIAIRQRDAAKADTPVTVLNQRYLTVDVMPDAKCIIVKSGHGTGKSTWVRDDVVTVDKGTLYVVPSQSLASDVTSQLSGFIDYRNEDRLQDAKDVVCCIDSIERLGEKKFHTIVIDESEQVAAAILKQNAKFDAGNVAGQLEYFCHHAERVTYMDADAGARTEQLAERAGLTPHWVHNKYQPQTDAIVERVGSYDEFVEQYEQDDNQKYLYCSERKTNEEMHATYGGTQANGKTDNTDLMQRIASGEKITDNIVATSALGTGVSIDNHDIETVYANLKPGQGLPTALSAVQGMMRARNVKRFVIYCPDVKPTDARPVDEQEIIERELLRPKRLTLKHMEPNWRTDLNGTEFDERLIGLYPAHVADNNRQLNDYWGTIKSRFEELGATVIESETTEKKSTRRRFLKAARQAQRENMAEQCKTMPIPSRKSYDHNEVQKALFACVDDLEMSEDEARETAARDIIKPGVIKGLKRRREYEKGQAELQRQDAEAIKSGNPAKKLISLRAKLEIDLLRQSGIASDWVTSADCRDSCQPWLHAHLFDYRGVTANHTLTGKNTGGLVVRVAERLGYEVLRKTVRGTTHYKLSRVENCNNLFFVTEETHPERLAA